MTTELQLKPYDMEITHEGINPFIGLNLNNVNMFRDNLTNYLISYLRSTDIENDKDAEIVWLSSTYFIKEMMGLYTSLYFANQVSGKNYRVLGSVFIESLVNNNQIKNPEMKNLYYKGLPKLQLWKRPLRVIKSRIINDSIPYCTPNMLDKNDILTFSRSALIVEHSKNISERLVIGKFNDWYSSGAWQNKAVKGISEKTENLIIDFLEKTFRELGDYSISEFIKNYAKDTLSLLTKRTKFYLDEIKLKSKLLPNTLWISSGAIFYNRILARVVMMNGGNVYGHEHGTGVSWIDTYVLNLVDFNYINNYVTYSPGMVDEYKKVLKHKYCLNPNCNVITINQNNSLKDIKKTNIISSKKPKSIMYLSTLYLGDTTRLIPTMSDFSLVDWQVKLFSYLFKQNFELYFKPHPESHSLPSPLFEKMFNAKILKGMFHEFYNKADVIIADFPLSTAFIEALQYGLPTVLIDLSIVKISNKAKKMLSKRCSIVDGSIDCNGRVDIDFNAIKSSILNASSKVTDTSFLDYYAPSNVKVK